MEQLIEIHSVPMKLEWRIQHAKYEIKTEPSSFKINRTPGAFQVNFKRGNLLLDTYDARSSIGLKTVAESMRENRDLGIQTAYSATANIAEEGNMMMNYYQSDSILADISIQRTTPQIDTALGFSPSVPVNIEWEPHDFSMRYEMDKLNFEWRTNQQIEVEYIPSKIEYYVTSYPKVNFTYVGKPIYVPPSASPDYEENTMDVLV